MTETMVDSVDMSIESMEADLAAAQDSAVAAAPALLTVLKGNPTPEELAALVAVVAAAASNAGDGSSEPSGPLENWGSRAEALNIRGRHSFAPRSFVNGDLGLY